MAWMLSLKPHALASVVLISNWLVRSPQIFTVCANPNLTKEKASATPVKPFDAKPGKPEKSAAKRSRGPLQRTLETRRGPLQRTPGNPVHPLTTGNRASRLSEERITRSTVVPTTLLSTASLFEKEM